MDKLSRRTFMGAGLIGVLAGVFPDYVLGETRRTALQPTPPEIQGPFYPVMAQKDKDFDLTLIKGNTVRAGGRVIVIEGRIIDVDGRAISDASVELWQANAAGRYNHPHDPNTAPIDPNFQGWAIVPSGEQGSFHFKTIYPGTYPASRDWMRPPHIHFKVSKLGYVGLTTQMYFLSHGLNDKDLLIKRKTIGEQKLMMATRIESNNDEERYKYDIVLQKA